jgi:hypothetical protein
VCNEHTTHPNPLHLQNVNVNTEWRLQMHPSHWQVLYSPESDCRLSQTDCTGNFMPWCCSSNAHTDLPRSWYNYDPLGIVSGKQGAMRMLWAPPCTWITSMFCQNEWRQHWKCPTVWNRVPRYSGVRSNCWCIPAPNFSLKGTGSTLSWRWVSKAMIMWVTLLTGYI